MLGPSNVLGSIDLGIFLGINYISIQSEHHGQKIRSNRVYYKMISGGIVNPYRDIKHKLLLKQPRETVKP